MYSKKIFQKYYSKNETSISEQGTAIKNEKVYWEKDRNNITIKIKVVPLLLQISFITTLLALNYN